MCGPEGFEVAFASLDADDASEPLAEINMVPLIDVMLVLLVIFMVTAPLLTHAVKVDLPRATSAPNRTPPANIQLSLDASGQVYWNGEAVDAGQLATRFVDAGARTDSPELHLRAAGATPYERVAQIMSEAARHGVTRIGFITEPRDPR